MSDPRILRSAQIFFLATLLSTPLLAQEPQSHQRGLTADTAYQLGSLDSVNLFNGNLILNLPIGTSYPVGPDLAYGINLVYNSNGWAYDERTCNQNGALQHYAVPIPEWTSNAGFGWTVNFGRLFYPDQEPENKDNIYWVYVAPDGSRRNFVYRDGQLLAVVEPNQTYHFHLDHLGSPRVVTNATGTKVAFHAYYPFGLEATDPPQSDFQLKFTGHERDENGGGTLLDALEKL